MSIKLSALNVVVDTKKWNVAYKNCWMTTDHCGRGADQAEVSVLFSMVIARPLSKSVSG